MDSEILVKTLHTRNHAKSTFYLVLKRLEFFSSMKSKNSLIYRLDKLKALETSNTIYKNSPQ